MKSEIKKISPSFCEEAKDPVHCKSSLFQNYFDFSQFFVAENQMLLKKSGGLFCLAGMIVAVFAF